MTESQNAAEALRRALDAPDASTRLRAALAAGTHPHVEYIDVLVEQFAHETEFLVRDMLTWALINQDRERAIARVLAELDSANTQSRAQALHAISKFAEPSTWTAITDAHLFDKHDEVARTAWRAAVIVVPVEEREALAAQLCTQLGRGDTDVQLSLSRELLNLGDAAVADLQKAKHHKDVNVRAHAIATERIAQNPESGFSAALDQAKRVASLHNAPLIDPNIIN